MSDMETEVYLPALKALNRAREFMENLQGEAGISARDVDRLCGILHGRADIEPKPLDNYDE